MAEAHLVSRRQQKTAEDSRGQRGRKEMATEKIRIGSPRKAENQRLKSEPDYGERPLKRTIR